MNLRNKTDKELWDMLYAVEGRMKGNEIDGMDNNECEIKHKYEIQQEIIRREKDNEHK